MERRRAKRTFDEAFRIEVSPSGYLGVGDGQNLFWETAGNPNGWPAVYLHGGPGGGFSDGSKNLFDTERHRIVMFDQRGCGRSTPLADNPDVDLSVNTTSHLVSDIETLREHLGISTWVVLGASWGTTLGLAYAEAHPDRVDGLVLALVGTTSRREVDWITEDMGRVFPEQWDRFKNAVPDSLRHLRLVDAYAELLASPDPEVREKAALEWCLWEDAHMSLTPGREPQLSVANPTFRSVFARLVTHYWRNSAFLGEDQLIAEAHRLSGTPGVLLHGRYDVSGPLETAWRLAKTWTDADLIVLDEAGHGGGDDVTAAIREAVVRVTPS